MAQTVILLTTHLWNSKRRAGFHWIADALWRQGWNTYFVTDYLSLFDKLRGDYRFKHLPAGGVKTIVAQKERFFSYVCYHRWRPLSRMGPILNRLTYPFFRRYSSIELPDLEPAVEAADLLIFESSMGLMFFERFKALNSRARYVYRVSDDIDLFRMHPVVLDAEARAAPLFDLISVPTPHIYNKFADLSHVRLQRHGIPLHLFRAEHENPYENDQVLNCVFVGNLFLDYDFIDRASRVFPDVRFHIIGPFEGLPQHANIVAYGEIPYDETIPYVKHADIGLNPRTIPSLADSNKMFQYQFCQLPVIMSDIDHSEKPYVFYYSSGDDASIRRAIENALSYDRSKIPKDEVRSWDQLAGELAGELG